MVGEPAGTWELFGILRLMYTLCYRKPPTTRKWLRLMSSQAPTLWPGMCQWLPGTAGPRAAGKAGGCLFLTAASLEYTGLRAAL